METKLKTKQSSIFPHYLIILATVSTLANIVCGLAGIFAVWKYDDCNLGLQMLLLGAIFDFVDGKFAKMAPTESDFGTYADSFADVITFAILPGYLIVYSNLLFTDTIPELGQLYAGIYAFCCWYRLVKFAIKPTGVQFEGLPAPAAAMFMGSAVIISRDPAFHLLFHPTGLILTALIVLISLLMISKIDYPSPKRMFASDNILITFSGVIGFLFILIPSPITACFLLAISALYTFAGPYYLTRTKQLIEQLEKENSSPKSENTDQ